MNYIYIAFPLLSYLCGSIPFGLLIAKFKNIDIRKHGSGNIGATNVTRIIGKKLGLLTLLLDTIKPLIVLYISTKFNISDKFSLIIASCAIIGHIFPIWLNFKGGKAVASTLGVIIFLNPLLGALMIMLWILIFLITKISAASSITIFILAPIYSCLIIGGDFSIFILFISILIIFKHKQNIINIINKKENSFK